MKGTMMNALQTLYRFYLDGFRNMTVGKTLWKVIVIKLIIILLFLNVVVYDKSIHSEYTTPQEKSDYVYKNMIGKE
jgi:hypothetical protein